MPSRLAQAQKIAELAKDNAVITSDSVVVFADLFARLGTVIGRRYAAPIVCSLLLRRLFLESDGPWQGRANDPYAIDAFSHALNEIRAAGITTGHFANYNQKKISPELAAIIAVLTKYEQAFDEYNWFDDADKEREAILAVLRGHPYITNLKSVHVANGTELFGSRLDLLAAFSKRGLVVDVQLPYDNERRTSFAWPEASLHRIEASNASKIEIKYDNLIGSGPLAHFRQVQFTKKMAPKAPVQLIEVNDVSEHARATAEIVKKWLEAGVTPNSIVIVVADYETHATAIMRELASFDIATKLPQGIALISTRAGEAILTALKLAEQEVQRESLIDLWFYLERWVKTNKASWSTTQVVRKLRRSGVRSNRIGGYRNSLIGKISPSQSEEHDHELTVALVESIEDLIANVSQIADEDNLQTQIKAIVKIADFLFAKRQTIECQNNELLLELSLLAAFANEQEAVQQIISLIDTIAQAVRQLNDQTKITRREITQIFELELRKQRMPSPAGPTAISIVPPSELVATNYKRVIFAGVDTDVFPKATLADAVLTDELRSEINAHVGLRLLQYGSISGREALPAHARDYWLWLEIIASASNEIIVTCMQPEAPESADATGRSEIVQEILRAIGVNNPQKFFAKQTQIRATKYNKQLDIERRINYATIIENSPFVLRSLSEGSKKRLASHIKDNIHSASHFDYLGMCAFRYFANAVLHLAHDDVPALGADARDQGSLMHAALDIVYRDIVNQGGLKEARNNPQKALTRAKELLEAAAESILIDTIIHPLLAPAALQDANNTALRILADDLNGNDDREPLKLEYRFDDRSFIKRNNERVSLEKAAPPLVLNSEDGSYEVKIRGSIDRIDHVDNTIEAIDYKRSFAKRTDGRHFQLPLYLAVAWRDFSDNAQKLAAHWIVLRDRKRHIAVEASTPQLFLQNLRMSFFARLERVLGGDISPDPKPATLCERCDYRALCRFSVVSNDESEIL
ncbi:MAG: PD-(D/E)XK nuclease family protein [Deltaproteobacteria bacterium]|nr:PD-(D/E)XK nuclease family protein [Deltaproteobacteria bacterium]